MSLSSRRPAEIRPQKIGPLAKLPVFLDLQDKKAIIAGGSAAAAWKAELLTASGARVTVFATAFAAEMLELHDRVVLVQRPWRQADLQDVAFAILDTQDDEEAAAFRAAAKAVGAICNVIDRPAYCDVQFGAIVNRSPVVVGISTDGAAPVLAQAIRRRIETVLPATLGAWAEAARRIRGTIARRFAAPSLRRDFWNRFSERIFTEADLPGDAALISAPAGAGGGHVTLVGAGPGDAELLTLKAMRALQSADVILFDDLVSDEVLELARREAKRMLVGKRGGRPSCKQQDINDLMVRLARQGKRVVRLKAGDPMIFGRAGEEIAALDAAGIPVDIVPGITAAVAAASRLGVSLTHRHAAQSLRFVTAHSRRGGLPEDLDWKGLADPATTLVFYMAGRTGTAVAARLIRSGLDPATPVSLIASVSRPDEDIWLGRLDQVAEGLAVIGLERPVLMGVGSVFAGMRTKMSVLSDLARAANS